MLGIVSIIVLPHLMSLVLPLSLLLTDNDTQAIHTENMPTFQHFTSSLTQINISVNMVRSMQLTTTWANRWTYLQN